MSMSTYILWTLAASLLGLLITAVFVGVLRLKRSVFLAFYVPFIVLFLSHYVRWANLNVGELLKQNLIWGVVVGVIVSVILIRNVNSQPASPRSQGAKLYFELFWFGLVYGAVDGLFLSVFPVVLAWHSFPTLGSTVLGKIGVALLALLASVFIAVSYHAGYPEFRNSAMRFAIIGNGLISLAFLLSLNPISSFGSHAVMHIAAVLHGSEGTVQLPPHYGNTARSGKTVLKPVI
jgi:hypothetical protein